MTSKATKKTAKKTTQATTAATKAKAKGKPKATPKAKTLKAATRAKPASKGATKRSGSKPKAKTAAKRKGILAIAAEMLARSKKPMGCKEIVEQAIDQGLWETKGKTPSATLYAAIIREIAAKGKDARFKKVDRGLFTCGVGK